MVSSIGCYKPKSGWISRLVLVEGCRNPSTPRAIVAAPPPEPGDLYLGAFMSVHVTSPIWKLKKEHGISSTQKLILVKIGDCAWDDGSNAFPKIATIAKETCLEKRTVQKNLRELEEKKFLLIQKEATYDFPTSYKVNMKKIKALVLGDELDSPHISKGESDDARDDKDSSPEVNLNTEGVNLNADRGELDSPKPLINHHINHQEEPSMRHPNGRVPAIELFKRINHRNPPKKLYGTIDRIVGDDFGALLRWGRIIRKWVASGYNQTNYNGMLEVFRNGWERDKVGDSDSEKERRKYLKGWFDE